MAAVVHSLGLRARVRAWAQARHARWRARTTARDAGEVELTARRVYILPTRPGLMFAVLLLALLIGSVNYSLGLGFALTFLAGACALVDMVATNRNLARLHVVAGRADPVFAGEDAPFEFIVRNPTRLARYAVRIDVDHVSEPRHALDVAAGGTAPVVVRTASTRRGWLRAPRVRLSTSFPLGLFGAWAYWQPDSRVLVYPFPETAAPPLPLSGEPSPDGTGSAGGDDFAGVRSYQAGDPLRHLAWRQIARLDPMDGGQLVTKHFEGGARAELVLDFAALPAALDVELRLSRMARWVLEAEGRALPYALRLPGVRYDAALGPAHQDACLRALALYGMEGS